MATEPPYETDIGNNDDFERSKGQPTKVGQSA